MIKSFLIIQTAFIGDVVLATALVEKLAKFFPNAKIDFLVRKGNESLLNNNPHLNEVLVWDKKQNKYSNLFNLASQVRKNKYDVVINLQRFASTGFLAGFSKASQIIGFKKNPLSFLFTKSFKHTIGDGKHEVERNLKLIEHLTNNEIEKPNLYPTKEDFEKVKTFKSEKYITLSPASVWFTKALPMEKWIELINLKVDFKIYLLGGPSDKNYLDEIKSKSIHPNLENLAGKLSFLQSTALMKDAEMNYVNDSAPLHFASAINAPTTAFFCSTTPKFGFGPLSSYNKIVETKESLSCKPCGLHGKKECPRGHFKCGKNIDVSDI